MPPLPPPNPYIAGNAVGGKRGFFGRQDILREVERVLSRPDDNAIVLYGQRRVGKTSILLQLLRRLPSPPFVPIYFDLMDKTRLPINQVLYELAVTVANEVDLPPPQSADFKENEDAFRRILLPQLYEALGEDRRPVFLLDEFDVLDLKAEQTLTSSAAAKAFRPYLRQLMTTEKRLGFVFVVGRRMDELSVEFLSTFKAATARQVSALPLDEANTLILQAEKEDALRFEEAAVNRISALTRGHPYLTQLTCQILFDRAYDLAEDDAIPCVTVEDVEAVTPKVLDAGANALQWIWDGLPPAERIIFSAIASHAAEGTVFTEDDITVVLQEAGIRILMRELNLAPQTLVNWQMLEQVDGGYRFYVELMRRWVALNKPLNQVKDELDRINPLADNLYQTAQGFYQQKNNDQAIAQLQQALTANPNHLKAHLLLGTILRDENRLVEAVAEFEKVYQLDEREGRFELLQTLLQQGESFEKAHNDESALAAYNRVLAVSPREQTAHGRKAAIWEKRGDQALSERNLAAAIEAYRQAGADKKLAEVKTQKLKADLEQASKEAVAYEAREEWAKAAAVYERLGKLDPDEPRWQQARERVEGEKWLAERYAEGGGYIQQKEWVKAQKPLAEVINQRPDYKDAAQLLALANQRSKGQQAQEGVQRRHLYLYSGAALVTIILIIAGILGYSQLQIRNAAGQAAATATAQATASEADSATRIAVAIQGTQTVEAAAQETAQAPTAPPTNTRAPQPTPIPTATIDADLTVYDNFNNPEYNGEWNPARWGRMSGDTNFINIPAEQQDGVLVLSHEKLDQSDNDGIFRTIDPVERKIDEIKFFEAKFMLDDQFQGSIGGIGTIVEMSGSDESWWWFNCHLQRSPDSSEMWANCGVDNIVNMNSGGNDLSSVDPQPAKLNVWYTFRTEIDPDTAIITFYLDGAQIGNYVPDDPDIFKNGTFFLGLTVLTGESNGIMTGYVDDVRIGVAK